jgi:hypothetical protein
MRSLSLLLLFISVILILLSCNSKMGIKRDSYGRANKKIETNNQKETYGKRPRKDKGMFNYNSNKKRVTTRSRAGAVGKCKHGKGIHLFGKKRKKNEGPTANIKKEWTGRVSKGFAFIEPADERKRKNLKYDTKHQKGRGSYSFNAKKKRVLKKKWLFVFTRHAREKETSTFSGGKARKFFLFNIYNSHKHGSVHRKGVFRLKKDNAGRKKKKMERDLFNPKMGIKI